MENFKTGGDMMPFIIIFLIFVFWGILDVCDKFNEVDKPLSDEDLNKLLSASIGKSKRESKKIMKNITRK